MSRQLRRFLGLNFLQHGIGIRTGDCSERSRRPLKELPGLLHGHERILKRRRRRIIRNRLFISESCSAMPASMAG